MTPVAICAALGDQTRWEILERLGDRDLSASALADILPVSRQAIAKHLSALEAVGLISSRRAGREIVFSALGSSLRAVAQELDVIGSVWERRLDAIRQVAESP